MYKVGQPIRVVYQPEQAKSGETVTMEIFDETSAKDAIDYPDVVMTEMDAIGRYEATFTPDTIGNWTVTMSYGSNKGKIVKQYVVGNHDLDSIGDFIGGISDGVPFVT